MTKWIASIYIAAIVVSLYSNAVCAADDPEVVTDHLFQAKVVEAIARRDALRTGEFEYTIEHKLPNSDVLKSYQRGDFLFDFDNATSMHVFERTEGELDETRALRDVPAKKGGMLVTPKDYIVFTLGADFGFVPKIEPERFATTRAPFDFRAFGFAYWGDIVSNQNGDSVLAGYFTWPDPMVLKRENGRIEYNCVGTLFTLDIERDYWITKHELILQDYKRSRDGKWEKDKRKLVTACDAELTQKNGFWVPSRVLYRSSSGGTMQFKLDWKSLNTPIQPKQIERNAFISRVGKPVK